MWQTIIGGLAVAAITGLSVVAYRHPAAYARAYLPLVGVVIGAWAIGLAYGIGFRSGFNGAVLATLKLNVGSVVETPNSAAPTFLQHMAPAIVYAYLSFLRLVPHLLRDETGKAQGPKSDP